MKIRIGSIGFLVAVLLVFFTNGVYAQKELLPEISYRPDALERVPVNVRPQLDSSLVNFLYAINTYDFGSCFSIDFEYLQTEVNPFPYLLDAQKSARFDDTWFFKPHVTFVALNSDESYVVKIAFIGIDPVTETPILRLIHSLVAVRKGDIFQFYSPLELAKAEWTKRQIQDVTFYYQDTFDEGVAKDFAQLNVQFAEKFDIPVIDVTYFKCRDGRVLFYILGCDYINNAYFAKTGGIAEPWRNHIFAANNSESYSHELVHLYTSKKFGADRNRIADEGYCTYLGGSGELSLAELAALVKRFLDENPDADMLTLFKNDQQLYGEHSTMYTLSGLLMRLIESEHGADGIRRIMTASSGFNGFFDILNELLGINEENFSDEIAALLAESK